MIISVYFSNYLSSVIFRFGNDVSVFGELRKNNVLTENFYNTFLNTKSLDGKT